MAEIVVREQKSTYQGQHDVRAHVVLEGRTLTLKAFQFRVGGVDYELVEDQEHDFEPAKVDTLVRGYLVRDRKTGAVSLLVEERNGTAPIYVFDGSSPYELIITVFMMFLPAGAHGLEDAKIIMIHSLPVPAVERPVVVHKEKSHGQSDPSK